MSTAGDDTGTGADACIGVDPSAAQSMDTQAVSARQDSECEPGNCLGQAAPVWSAVDYQPLSCGFGQSYGLSSFIGKPVLLAQLAGWCSYCQAQSSQLEKMRLQLQADGIDVHMVIVNATSADNDENRESLIDRCSLPIFQDTADVGIWNLNSGGKDDFYLYDAQGILQGYFPHGGATPTNLSTDPGYKAIKSALESLASSASER